jgi:hypothetical protein
MEEQKSKFCVKDCNCTESGLSLSILMSNGCLKHSFCENFSEKNNKIREKVLPIKGVCSIKKCYKDNMKNKINSGCLDCKKFSIEENGFLKNKIDLLIRCLNTYCSFGKNNVDLKCLDCIQSRIFSEKKQTWVQFRGGKDLKGNNF